MLTNRSEFDSIYLMKHKNSILLCEMDDGTLNVYVNGVAVFVDNKLQTPVEKIANCNQTKNSVQELLFKGIGMFNSLKESE